jgi:hypothetical protein
MTHGLKRRTVYSAGIACLILSVSLSIAQARKVSETSQNQVTVLELLDALASSEAEPLKDWSDRLRQIRAIEQQRQLPQPKP